MSYQLFNKKNKKKKLLFYLLILLVFVLYIIFKFISNFNLIDFSIYTKKANNFFIEKTYLIFKNKSILLEENIRLKEEITKNSLKRNFEKDVFEYNQELLSRLGEVKEKRVLFKIYSRPGFNLYDTFFVSDGNTENVKIGDIFYSSQYFALGNVDFVSKNNLKLSLFSSPNKQVRVELNNSIFQAEGIGGGTFNLKIPRDFEVNEDQPVYLAGKILNILGYVKEVNLDPQDSFKTIIFQSPVNIYEIDTVEVEPNSHYIEETYEVK